MEVRQDASVETSSEAKEMPADASAPSSESRESAGANNAASADENSLRTIALVIYGCMALGIFTGGLTSIVAVILAYVKRGDATGTIYQGHMTWVISTFWVGLAVSILGMMTMIIGVGLFIIIRPEERTVGNECVSTCISRWSPD